MQNEIQEAAYRLPARKLRKKSKCGGVNAFQVQESLELERVGSGTR